MPPSPDGSRSTTALSPGELEIRAGWLLAAGAAATLLGLAPGLLRHFVVTSGR